MFHYCDVALPVPLDTVFTYHLPGGVLPEPGTRVLVPFRRDRMVGVITACRPEAPQLQTKAVLGILDEEPALSPELMRLGHWMSQYYLAPLGEIFRAMLPLSAEFRRTRFYRITEQGRMALDRAAAAGAPPTRRSAEEQDAEFRVLDYLLGRDQAREETLKAAARVNRQLLDKMARKNWVVREGASLAAPAVRLKQVAVLKRGEGKLSAKQQELVHALQSAGGRLEVVALGARGVSRSTLRTLEKHDWVELVEEPIELTRPTLAPPPQGFQFNAAQRSALSEIQAAVEGVRFSALLIHGVTGSGKTAVYLAAMQAVLAQGRSALLLVPEIGLTPAMAAEVYRVFGDQVAILHSALSDKERAEHWHRIRRGQARAVVGTRSAVFAPLSNLALLIVDEEQDSSYKQEDSPRYHARDVGIMRAKLAQAVVVLGSATPSLESYFNAQKGRYRLIEMPDRVEKRPLPEVELVDMRVEFQETGREQAISRKLAEEIRLRLGRGEQAMVLLNRRGYSPVALCRKCGKTVECQNCAVSLTHHKGRRRMLCHYCGFTAAVPRSCPHCASDYVYFLGIGSEKLEELLRGAFPQARIARLDRDTVRGHADFERVLNALHRGELDLVVGTQMIAKGHDIHGVTLVGVVGADTALSLPDFRAGERTFQLLTQVAGRAGRGGVPGKVVLQSYFPEHYAIQYAARQDFTGFYEKELRFRSWMHYPPWSALANVIVRSAKLDETLRWAGGLGRWFESTSHEGVRVLGPAAAPIERLKTDYRYHFIIKAASREKLNNLLRAMLAQAAKESIPRTNLIVDVDAQSLM
jgi:primosomal protein N' (replication factor Y)